MRRDEVVRKRSSRAVVLRGLPDLGRSATFPVCWNLFSSRLVDSWRCKCRATAFTYMPAISIPMALSRCSNVIPGRRGMTFDVDFQKKKKNTVFVLTIRKLSNCVLCDLRGIIRFAVHILHVTFINVKIYDYIMA